MQYNHTVIIIYERMRTCKRSKGKKKYKYTCDGNHRIQPDHVSLALNKAPTCNPHLHNYYTAVPFAHAFAELSAYIYCDVFPNQYI